MLRSCVGTSRDLVAKLALAMVFSTPSTRAEERVLFMSSALVLLLGAPLALNKGLVYGFHFRMFHVHGSS